MNASNNAKPPFTAKSVAPKDAPLSGLCSITLVRQGGGRS
jgi:hypothetical protein